MSATLHTSDAELSTGNDPYLWLEDITSERSLAWVRAKTPPLGSWERLVTSNPAATLIGDLQFEERIPHVDKHGARYFWRDATHVRGLCGERRWKSIKRPIRHGKPCLTWTGWRMAGDENWVWKGCDVRPTYDRALIFSPAAERTPSSCGNLTWTQENYPRWIFLPEAKTGATWRNRDTLYVGTDFSPGSLTLSGYPRIVKEWDRSSMDKARIVFEGETQDVSVGAAVARETAASIICSPPGNVFRRTKSISAAAMNGSGLTSR